MKINRRSSLRIALLISVAMILTIESTRLGADTGTCGGASITLPFTDVPAANVFFCSIAEAFFSGLANGTSPTTYNPSGNVPREQMAAFVTRTMDQSVKRSSRRAALDQFWTDQVPSVIALTSVGNFPVLVKSDGLDLWVANQSDGTVSRVRASDGSVVGTWTGANGPSGLLIAMGKVFVVGQTTPGKLYQIDPTQAPGAVTNVTNVGDLPERIAFDGQRIWTANTSSVSIITLNPTVVTTVSTGFNWPYGILYDGTNIWLTDFGDGLLKKLSSTGTILQPVSVGGAPRIPAFDGTNIWVPSSSGISVVRATGGLAGTVLATLTMSGGFTAAFDGERILVTNQGGDSVSLWKASDLTPIGTFSTGVNSGPVGACSDGLNFWITLTGTNKLARF